MASWFMAIRPTTPPAALADSLEAARSAGLRHVSDRSPGIRRVRSGRSFRYLTPDDKPLRDPEALLRIRKLAVPPAWTRVWICPLAHGHIQATGRDARGRKQYRYHPEWRRTRDETKYHRMLDFGHALPRIRAQVQRDLRRPELSRRNVLGAVVRLLETTLIRVGNEEYARENRSFGLTTMRDRHATIQGARVHFEFRGKAGVSHAIDLHDRRIARIVRQCRDLPGQELFQYIDAEGERHSIGSAEVNDYVRELAGGDFSAKDFRTWAGTVLAARALKELVPFSSQRQAKRNVLDAIEAVAMMLGNTRSVCRKCYVHPEILAAYFDGTLIAALNRRARAARPRGLRPDEAAVFAFLKRRLARDATRARRPAGTRRRAA
jgi:DNA topoisomerase I